MLPNVAKRTYTDPQYCHLPKNSSKYECLRNETGYPLSIDLGKREGDPIFTIQLDSIYIIVIAVNWASGMLLSLLVTVPLSGGYVNPAISVTLATMSRLQWYHKIETNIKQILLFLG